MQPVKKPVAGDELLPTTGQASVRTGGDAGVAVLHLAGLKMVYGGCERARSWTQRITELPLRVKGQSPVTKLCILMYVYI